MKNIEKYTNTKDALEAYDSFDSKRVPFDVWLGCEYEEPHQTTLLEAAEAVSNIAEGTLMSTKRRLFRELRIAIEREKAKPIRNFDKYKTAKEAFNGFREMCFCNNVNECKDCRFRNSKDSSMCGFAYLYAEAKKSR